MHTGKKESRCSTATLHRRPVLLPFLLLFVLFVCFFSFTTTSEYRRRVVVSPVQRNEWWNQQLSFSAFCFLCFFIHTSTPPLTRRHVSVVQTPLSVCSRDVHTVQQQRRKQDFLVDSLFLFGVWEWTTSFHFSLRQKLFLWFRSKPHLPQHRTAKGIDLDSWELCAVDRWVT